MKDILDESGYDNCYLAMKERDERLALSILKDKNFDRYHLNKDRTLLSWAIYFCCENVVDVLLEDKKMIQLSSKENPYYMFYSVFDDKKTDFFLYSGGYGRIFDKILKIEEIDFNKAVDACMLFIGDRWLKKNGLFFYSNYISFLTFYDEAIMKILEQERLAKIEISPNQAFGCKSLLYYVVKYGRDEEFEKIMKSGIDINKQFAQDEISNKLYYKDDGYKARDEWLVDNALTVSLGCDEVIPVANKIDYNKFYTLIFNQQLDSKYILEAINRICYSKLPFKEELIIKIVTNREWPKKDIYNKTLLSLAFYGLNKAYRFFLNNPNVYINTLTLELIHEYSRKFYKEAYHDEDYKIEKNDEQKKDIEEVTMQLLMTRQDLISEEEKLPYDLLIFDMMASTSEFTDNIIEKFYDKELANKIAMDSWWNLRKETGIKIRPHINLPSYIIDHIDKFILQDNEKNKELYVWAKKYTDRLVKEALYLKEHDESGKVKVNTKLLNK